MRLPSPRRSGPFALIGHGAKAHGQAVGAALALAVGQQAHSRETEVVDVSRALELAVFIDAKLDVSKVPAE
jgi:hypothetical protein